MTSPSSHLSSLQASPLPPFLSFPSYPIIILADSDVEDTFSSTHSPDYIPASPDYFPASPGNTSPNFLDDLTKNLLASLALLPFYDDPYMKVMQAYDATDNELPIPPPDPITSTALDCNEKKLIQMIKIHTDKNVADLLTKAFDLSIINTVIIVKIAMVAFLSKPIESDGFEQIVDFFECAPYKAKTINGKEQLHALVDGKKIIITESSVRRDLKLADEEGIDCLPNSTIFEQLALMGPKTTAWNEFSSTMASTIIFLATNQKFNFSKLIFDSMIRNLDNVSGKFLMYPSLVRATTTASSLEAEQDSGNINNSQSKATPNESGSQGTNSGGGHRLKFDELMALCTTLQNMVLDLEQTKTTQHNEIANLKRRVKKLEKKYRSRTHKLKRLFKVDEEITLVRVHDVNVSAGEEEVVEVINTAKLIIDVAQVSTAGDKVSTASAATTVSAATTTTATTVDDITLAQVLEEMKSTKPKQKGVVIQELGESTTTKSSQLSSQQSQDKVEFDEEERLAREKAEKEQEANIALIET
ncbi:hypothetical protein Tco_0066252 [Tanacetum coccineum]